MISKQQQRRQSLKRGNKQAKLRGNRSQDTVHAWWWIQPEELPHCAVTQERETKSSLNYQNSVSLAKRDSVSSLQLLGLREQTHDSLAVSPAGKTSTQPDATREVMFSSSCSTGEWGLGGRIRWCPSCCDEAKFHSSVLHQVFLGLECRGLVAIIMDGLEASSPKKRRGSNKQSSAIHAKLKGRISDPSSSFCWSLLETESRDGHYLFRKRNPAFIKKKAKKMK